MERREICKYIHTSLIVMQKLAICGDRQFQVCCYQGLFFILFLSLWVVIASSIHPPLQLPSLGVMIMIQQKYSMYMIQLGLWFFMLSCFVAFSFSLWYQIEEVVILLEIVTSKY